MTKILLKNLYRRANGALCSRHGNVVWTLGDWVEHEGSLTLGELGLHANPGADLGEAFRRASRYVYPLGGVWRVETDGEVLRDRDRICARRMRLVEQIPRGAAFLAAWPGGNPARLDDVDEVIRLARAIDWPARCGECAITEAVYPLAPWRNPYAPADYAAGYAVNDAAHAVYAAACAVAYAVAGIVATAAVDVVGDAVAYRANVAAVVDVAARAARYAYAQAVAPHDSRTQHASPFMALLHRAEGGSWQDVTEAFARER